MAPPAFERAVAYGIYQDRMRAAIHALKYRRMHPAAARMGRMLAQAILTLRAEIATEILVVPVPLHRRKRAERGFNQTLVLAQHALRAIRATDPEWRLTLAPRALTRERSTESQAGLTPRQRRLNVRGAFAVSDPRRVKDQHVLLVDDILTTGATVRAASLALRRAGAASVWVATLARARRIHNSFAGAAFAPLHSVNPTSGEGGSVSSGAIASMQTSGTQPTT